MKDDIIANYPQEEMAKVFLKLIDTIKVNTDVLKEKVKRIIIN